MTTIQAVRHVLENGVSLMRPRKDTAYAWDVKPAFSGKKRGWFYMDAFTASMLAQVHDTLKPELQEKFNRIQLITLIDFGWSHTK
jgi:hypothetical protein